MVGLFFLSQGSYSHRHQLIADQPTAVETVLNSCEGLQASNLKVDNRIITKRSP